MVNKLLVAGLPRLSFRLLLRLRNCPARADEFGGAPGEVARSSQFRDA